MKNIEGNSFQSLNDPQSYNELHKLPHNVSNHGLQNHELFPHNESECDCQFIGLLLGKDFLLQSGKPWPAETILDPEPRNKNCSRLRLLAGSVLLKVSVRCTEGRSVQGKLRIVSPP